MGKIKVGFLFMSLLIVGCSTVTINPEVSGKLEAEPTYEERKNFYFWGLSGEHRVDVQSICSGKKPVQMQSQQTFTDGFLGVITLGIYSPHSVKVWCS